MNIIHNLHIMNLQFIEGVWGLIYYRFSWAQARESSFLPGLSSLLNLLMCNGNEDQWGFLELCWKSMRIYAGMWMVFFILSMVCFAAFIETFHPILPKTLNYPLPEGGEEDDLTLKRALSFTFWWISQQKPTWTLTTTHRRRWLLLLLALRFSSFLGIMNIVPHIIMALVTP